jgi:hypothetical protein
VTHGPAPRTLIWTPAGTAELQLALHRGRVGSAVLVPVESGTVALPTPGADLSYALRLAATARELSGRAVVLRWDERGADAVGLPPPPGTVHGWHWGSRRAGLVDAPVRNALRGDRRARPDDQERSVTALSAALAAPPEQVAALVADWRTGGPDTATALFAAAGLADTAKVAGLVQAGQADRWLTQLPRPPRRWWGRRPGLAAGQPINAVLPVVPVTQGVAPTENAGSSD